MTRHESNEERRRGVRIKKIQLVQISRFDEEGFHADLATGRTLNLSRGGMRLELGHSLPLRSLVNVSVALGDEILELTGKVIYLEVIDDERNAMGIAFTDLAPEVQRKLDQIVRAAAG
ncbi:MAG: hypothetical protein D6696_15805 [Acidobacteria bacterium]|nr:MAG: hypothetical protein D6696_15805 [Acidobacteriota bacterium]